MAGGRNWLEGRARNPAGIPGARPSSWGRGEGGRKGLAAEPAPCPALIRRQPQRELEVNDDICLTEEREGGGGGPGRQTAPPGST